MIRTNKTYNNLPYMEWKPVDNLPIGVILYLHGITEIGTNLDKLLVNDIPKQLKAGLEKEYIVICIQIPSGTAFTKNQLLTAFHILDTYNLPRHVTGLSLGGMGTYAAVLNSYAYNGNQPGYFKTAAPIAGKTGILDYTKYVGTAVKIYHGTQDTTIKITPDRNLFKYLRVNGIDVLMKEYVAGHNVWQYAYKPDEYWNWLASKS